jgi:hypothetical protein
MKGRATAAALLALAVGGCGGDPQPDAVANRTAPAAMATPTPKPDTAQRLAAAVRAACPKGELVSLDDAPARKYDEHKLIDASFGPVLVSNGHMPDETASHAPGGLIAIHYLEERDGAFAVKPGFPKTYELGSFGHLSEWAVSDKFSDLPTVYAQGGGTFQGYTCSGFDLIELQPGGPALVAEIHDGYDNGGAAESGAQSIVGKIADVVKGKGFTMRFSGTRSFAERYTKRGGRYVIEGGPSQLPEC